MQGNLTYYDGLLVTIMAVTHNPTGMCALLQIVTMCKGGLHPRAPAMLLYLASTSPSCIDVG
jgi:hypothetical protein